MADGKEINQFKENNKTNEFILEKLGNQVKKQAKEIAVLEANNSKQAEEIAVLKADNGKQAEEIVELKAEIGKLKKISDEQSNAINEMKKDLQEMKKKMADAKRCRLCKKTIYQDKTHRICAKKWKNNALKAFLDNPTAVIGTIRASSADRGRILRVGTKRIQQPKRLYRK